MEKESKRAFDDLIDLEKDARAYGFDWPNCEMIIDQAVSECEEIREAIAQNESAERIQEEIGDLIHTAISLCIFAGFDTLETMNVTVKKFSTRMNALKEIARKRGFESLKDQTLEVRLQLWDEVKKLVD
jgi:uncharacterized protein YabN with tetrapyrrole methylase and pyrophosphatase domain